ncbi:hypothetical protein ACFSTC_11850 [Nonomuraea ferruginea]
MRTDTSSRSASSLAVIRPRVCRSSRIETRREARTSLTLHVSDPPLPSPHERLRLPRSAPGTWPTAAWSSVWPSSDDWEEFPGVSTSTRHFGGAANFDEIHFPTLGYSGLTLRLYELSHAAVVHLLVQQPHRHARPAAHGGRLRRRPRPVLRRRTA